MSGVNNVERFYFRWALIGAVFALLGAAGCEHNGGSDSQEEGEGEGEDTGADSDGEDGLLILIVDSAPEDQSE